MEAEAHLRLAKLLLLDVDSEGFAYSHFNRWEEVRNRVEHEYCHDIARKVWRRIQQEGPYLILRARDTLDHRELNEKIKDFSIKAMLFELVAEHAGKSYAYDDKIWKELLKEALRSKLGYETSQIHVLIKDKKLRLIERIKKMQDPVAWID